MPGRVGGLPLRSFAKHRFFHEAAESTGSMGVREIGWDGAIGRLHLPRIRNGLTSACCSIQLIRLFAYIISVSVFFGEGLPH